MKQFESKFSKRVPRILYSESMYVGADPMRNQGYIWRHQTIRPVALLNTWFAYHPHWSWLYRLSKDWGNPLCAAYCIGLNRLVNKATRGAVWDIDYDKVDADIRAEAEADHLDLWSDDGHCGSEQCVVHGLKEQVA